MSGAHNSKAPIKRRGTSSATVITCIKTQPSGPILHRIHIHQHLHHHDQQTACSFFIVAIFPSLSSLRYGQYLTLSERKTSEMSSQSTTVTLTRPFTERESQELAHLEAQIMEVEMHLEEQEVALSAAKRRANCGAHQINRRINGMLTEIEELNKEAWWVKEDCSRLLGLIVRRVLGVFARRD